MWSARRQRTHDDRPKEESIRFGQRNHLEPWGRKSPSIASLIDSDDSIEPEENLGDGMMDTAAPEGAFKMTNVHCKLLVLISKYGQMPVADEPETWIRELPLLVLVYEGITAGVFEMDYSPQCMTMSHTGVTRRMFLNISQEAKSAIDELREQKLISALKISSEDLQSVTAFQVGEYGRKFMSHTGVTRSMFLNSRSSSLSSSSPRSVSLCLSLSL